MTAAEHLVSIKVQIQEANLRTLAGDLSTAFAKIEELEAQIEKLTPKPAVSPPAQGTKAP